MDTRGEIQTKLKEVLPILTDKDSVLVLNTLNELGVEQWDVVVVVVVCFIQRPSKYIETTHITTFGRKKGNSDKTRTVKACNIQPYNKFKN